MVTEFCCPLAYALSHWLTIYKGLFSGVETPQLSRIVIQVEERELFTDDDEPVCDGSDCTL